MRLQKLSLALAFLIGAAVATASAQTPQQEKIHFTAVAPFELQGTNIVLAPGDYLLFQVQPNDRSLFALYQGDMTHSPVAMIRTVRIYYDLGRLPKKAKMLMEPDEASPQTYQMLKGWTGSGDYGWRVIDVTPKPGALNARIK